jgi:signal transduction histidine kinase
MDGPAFELSNLRDARLAPLATSTRPAWLWSKDARRIVWANPTGAALFGASSSAAISAREFDAADSIAAEIVKLAATLDDDAPPRLERLRFFGGDLDPPLPCLCSQIRLADGSDGILVVAREPAAPELSLSERAHRLLAGRDEPVAAYSAAGQLLCATQGAHDYLKGATSLAALGAHTLAAAALAGGHEVDIIGERRISIVRVGTGASIVLVVNFAPQEEDDLAEFPQAGSVDTPFAAPQSLLRVADEAVTGSTGVQESDSRNTRGPNQRRHPLRFVWYLDEHGRFSIDSDEFIAALAVSKVAVTGRSWAEIAAELALDPAGEITRAIATRDTWSGISISWPMDDGSDRITIELSGLPVFDHERAFRGYRGFGVCRDIARLARRNPARAENRSSCERASKTDAEASSSAAIEAPGKNVVPFPSSATEAAMPALSPGEHMAFRELSRKLTQGLAAIGIEHQPRNARRPQLEDAPAPVQAQLVGAVPDLRPLLDRVPVAILIYRLSQLLYANPAFLQCSGHPNLDTLIEAGGLDRIFIEPIGAAAAGANHLVTLQLDDAGKVVLQGELINVHWDGEPAHALVAIGAQDGWKARDQELVEHRRLAESASSAKSEFLARMSHEIRTPLNSIIGFSEVMMTEQFGAIGNERYREYIKDIHASGGHLLSLIDDLLDLSKIEAGKLPLTFTGLALNEVVQQCIVLMQPQAIRERIIIRTALADALPPVIADARSVRQILLNLLSNSIKFTGAGGQVIISTGREGEQVVLRVRDTGMGMSEEEIKIALEPFRQLGTTPRGGTGLGLPLTKAMAEANGAQFHLASTPQQGTLVEITFSAKNGPTQA